MDMSTDGAGNGSTMGTSMTFYASTMTPLYSASWQPTTTAGYAASCIFLVTLAALVRILLALKIWKESAWLDAEFNRRYVVVAGRPSKAERISQDSDSKRMILTENGVEEHVVVVKKRGLDVRPWRITVDPLRAVIDTVIAGLSYLL
jgi:hypothetical protein